MFANMAKLSAAGLPVIGFARGGVRDSVRDGETGVLYDETADGGLVAAIERFESLDLSETAIRANARGFTHSHFVSGMCGVLDEVAQEPRPTT